MADFADQAWAEVERYTSRRSADRGDVYGWFQSATEGPVAVILAALETPTDSFPEEIAGIRVRVERVPAPEKHA